MNKKLTVVFSSVILLVLPVVSLAFFSGGVPATITTLVVEEIIDIVFAIIWPIFVAFSVIMFLVYSTLFMTAKDDAAKLIQARHAVTWAVVGVAIAILAFSIPFIVRNTLGHGI